MTVLDVDKDGSISFVEFVTMLTLFRRTEGKQSEAEAKEIFKALKKDDSGYVTFEEMKRAWRMLMQPTNDAFNVETDEAVEHMDSNKDGKIDQQEFVDYLSSK